jgi:hypothetical protein
MPWLDGDGNHFGRRFAGSLAILAALIPTPISAAKRQKRGCRIGCTGRLELTTEIGWDRPDSKRKGLS